MKKRVFASLLAICLLGTSVFAATGDIKFQDNFEFEPINKFFVSLPEIRAYGENLLTKATDFESGDVADSYDISVANSEEENHTPGGQKSMKITNTATTANYRVTWGVSKDLLVPGGIYEFEAYVKSSKPYGIRIFPWVSITGQFEALSDNGHKRGYTECQTDWQKMTARFSIDAAATQDYLFAITVDWDMDGDKNADYPIFVDDVKLRKVENAVQAGNEAYQAGMPTYPISALAGKTNAQVVMDVKNETGAAQDLTLITAYYNGDGSLNTVLNVYKTSVPTSAAIQHVESNEFAVPAGVAAGEIKTFAWNNAEQLFPYTEKVDSEFVNYIKRDETTATSARDLWFVSIPTTKTWIKRDNLDSGNGSAPAAGHTESVESGMARSGVRALYIPSAATAEESYVGTLFDVEPGRKYQVEFYVGLDYTAGYYDNFRVTVGGLTSDRLKSDYSAIVLSPAGIWEGNLNINAQGGTYNQTKSALKEDRFFRVYGRTGNNDRVWEKMTFTFETPAAEVLYPGLERTIWSVCGSKMSLIFSQYTNNNINTSNQAGKGVWIDDVKITDIGAAGE